jgi:glutamate dehydrogenase
MTMTWKQQLQKQLAKEFNAKEAASLFKKYQSAFQLSYTDTNSAETAAHDVIFLEKLSEKNALDLFFYTLKKDNKNILHLRLYQWEQPIPLSTILPILENFDLQTLSEQPYQIAINDRLKIWISDFIVIYKKGSIDIPNIENLFKDALRHVIANLAENDGFNKLILSAYLSWREVIILRAYAKYLHQIRFRFSQTYIEQALAAHADIAKSLVDLFNMRHDPQAADQHHKKAHQLEEKILKELDAIVSLDEDRIIRQIFKLIKATLRTNYFQTDHQGHPKTYLAFKFNSSLIPELPLPLPLYEIFVYSPRFEAIHLRSAIVARGGIRWSDRREDFRTEVLGLMKAQKVKNAIIIPSGAKGGFVLKMLPENSDRENTQKEVIACYKAFMCGLLDLTDNIDLKDKIVIHPKDVVCYDDEDPYLVVAADKGTAAFSDIANGISKDYEFWLGDAFASGGETGYDHKAMGITARGAWESIKRHFRELEINAETTDITVIGIGDLSGDVFGNGMLYTKHLKLVAAFDHRDIFLDPHPDPKISYHERVRLFNLPTSSWQDYNVKLLSKGGGIFKRSAKSITLTEEVKKVLGTDATTVAPNELIRIILQAPVDLLYNGGIGTFVKASTESHADAGDRANDYSRVNGNELRCRVVGEGGNLGFTQLGRIEYALNNGLINTDFIDNSAGVDTSDHEVNLKILLNFEVRHGKLTEKHRNELIASVTEEVAALVLHDNFSQALVMSFSAFHSIHNMTLHTSYIKELEALNVVNRRVEFLPDDKTLLERKTAGKGLTRPELAVLLAYTKIYIKQEILKSKLPEDKYLSLILETAFPPAIRKKYRKAMPEHRLERDIIATQLSNQLVNEMGITFVYRLQTETGASIADIVRAYAIASQVFSSTKLNATIDSLDFKIPLNTQYDMLFNIRNLISISSRWFLRSPYLEDDLSKTIEHFATRVQKLESLVPELMVGYTKQYLDNLVEEFLKLGLPSKTAHHIATYRAIYTSLNVIDIATRYKFDLILTAHIYFNAGGKLNLVWFRDQIAHDSRDGNWNVLARLTLRDELDAAQRAITIAVMRHHPKETDPEKIMRQWFSKNKPALERWDKLLEMVHASTSTDYTMFFIVIRELLDLLVGRENFVVELGS